MSAFVGGIALGAASDLVSALLIKRPRSLGFIIPDCAIEESHMDQLVITEHPVETNASITDHAYKRPVEVTLRYGWSNSSQLTGGILGQLTSGLIAPIGLISGNVTANYIIQVYQQLQQLQNQRQPFQIVTGKRTYQNMLMASLGVVTDASSEEALMVTAVCREVIIVSTTVTQVSNSNMSQPDKTSAVQDNGTQLPTPTASPPQSSILHSLFGS